MGVQKVETHGSVVLGAKKQEKKIDFDKNLKFFRLKNDQNFNEDCSSEDDVESDGDDTSKFMMCDFSVPTNREDCLMSDDDGTSLKEQEDFAIDQLFGDSRGVGSRAGNPNLS